MKQEVKNQNSHLNVQKMEKFDRMIKQYLFNLMNNLDKEFLKMKKNLVIKSYKLFGRYRNM